MTRPANPTIVRVDLILWREVKTPLVESTKDVVAEAAALVERLSTEAGANWHLEIREVMLG